MVLRTITGHAAGREVTLEIERPLVLGRERGCDVILRDPRASRRHAEVRRLPGGQVLLRDLESTHGTWVAGERVAEAVLRGGEVLALGDLRLVVVVPAVEPVVEPVAGRSRFAAAGGPSKAAGSARQTVGASPQPVSAAAPTYSMVGRLLDARVRRSHRWIAGAAGAAGCVAAAIVTLAVLVGGSSEADSRERVPTVVAELSPSTVKVESVRDGSRTGLGSGWVLDADAGLVVTNVHVLNQGNTVRVVAGGRTRAATVVGGAPCEDVALLRLADRGGLRSARLAPPGAARQGATVVALGFPEGGSARGGPTSTTGVISDAHADYADGAADVPAYTDAIQTDTALNPGSSGGPLVDLEGRVVGMSAAVRSVGADGRARQGESYAIGADRLATVLAKLRSGQATGWTGLTLDFPTTEQLAARHLPAGLMVTGAMEGSPAARAGVTATQAPLVGVDSRSVGTTMRSYCAAAGAGTPASLAFADPASGKLRTVALRR